MTNLIELAARVEGLSGPDREVDLKIMRWAMNIGGPAENALHYTASLDAAMSLVPEGWNVGQWRIIGKPDSCRMWDDETDIITSGSTPALALTAAALRARAAQ